MPINTVKIYYNLVLILYAKGLVLKAVIAISIVFTAINEWLKALLASFILINIVLLNIRFLKAIKWVVKSCFSFFKLSLDLISIIRVLKILLKFFKFLLLFSL